MDFGNWWDQTVVSRLVKYGCGSEAMKELRAQIIPQASGRVFELGCGAGANQSLYDSAKVTSFSAIDPSPKLLEYARAEVAKKGWEADIRHGFGEAIPFADESFDTVVCTFTMCSVDDQMQALAELRRILKPGGTYLFAEHGRSPEPNIARWQERIDPLWSKIMGNCHLSRPVTAAMEQAGFKASPIAQQYREPGPRVVSWMEWGSAVKI
jgi:ubiquinone/menaquinone biosynthesis C-methylase UbiE